MNNIKLLMLLNYFQKIVFLKADQTYASALTKMNLSNKVYRRLGKIKLKIYKGILKK